MGKKKKQLKRERQIADELFLQVGMLAGQLHRIDDILINAQLPGPTIEAWSMQVRDLLSSLVRERGIVSGSIVEAFSPQAVAASSGPHREVTNDGEYTLLTDRDLVPPEIQEWYA